MKLLLACSNNPSLLQLDIYSRILKENPNMYVDRYSFNDTCKNSYFATALKQANENGK